VKHLGEFDITPKWDRPQNKSRLFRLMVYLGLVDPDDKDFSNFTKQATEILIMFVFYTFCWWLFWSILFGIIDWIR
jgi:membrane associated rhomboid family serine protease